MKQKITSRHIATFLLSAMMLLTVCSTTSNNISKEHLSQEKITLESESFTKKANELGEEVVEEKQTDIYGNEWLIRKSSIEDKIEMTQGENVITVALASDGTLTVSGTGAMPNLNHSTNEESISVGNGTYPWNDWKNRAEGPIRKIVIDDGITSIGTKSFIAANNVTSVVIGKDVKEIGAGALGQFLACDHFEVAAGNTSFVVGEDGALYSADKKVLYYYPCAKTGDVEGKFVVPSSVSLIGYNAFYASNVTTIEVEGGEQELVIGFGAFATNVSKMQHYLAEVTLPSRVKKICSLAFSNHKHLRIYCENEQVKQMVNETISGVKDVFALSPTDGFYEEEATGIKYLYSGSEAKIVDHTGNQEEVVIPSVISCNGKEYQVTEIGPFAFGSDVSYGSVTDSDKNMTLKRITIPSTIRSVEYGAFRFCTAITDIVFQGRTLYVDLGAFLTYSANRTVTLDLSSVQDLSVKETTGKLSFIGNLKVAKESYLDYFTPCMNASNHGTIASVEERPGYEWKFSWANNQGSWKSNELVVAEDTTWTDENGVTWTVDVKGSGATLKQYDNKSQHASIVVPSFVMVDGKQYPVVALAKGLFGWAGAYDASDSYNTYIQSVVIPETVTRIGADIFRYSQNLQYVKISSKSVLLEASRSFSGCYALKVMDLSSVEQISFGDGGTSYFANAGASSTSTVVYLSSKEMVTTLNNRGQNVGKFVYAVTNGGILPVDETMTNTKLSTPVREGYTFEGWYESEDFQGEAVVDAVKGKTYYAKWSVNIDENGYCVDISSYRNLEGYTAPVKEGFIFAGWYSDAEYTTPIGKDVTSGPAYAKFVDAKVMDVKAQITAGTKADSTSTDMRIVSTVDSLMYRDAGFIITVNKTTQISCRNVYKKIVAKDGGVAIDYAPTVFSNSSEYFTTYTIKNIPNASFRTEIKITPYWVTMDGTMVKGTEVIKTVNDCLNVK